MAGFNLDTIAAQLRAAQDTASTVPPPTHPHPGCARAGGSEVAPRVHEQRLQAGDRPVGRKIGYTNVSLWAQLDVQQSMWGHVYERTLVRLPGGRGSFSLAGVVQPRIEPEIVFGLSAEPPPDADAQDALACVEWVAAGFEIGQSHFADQPTRAPDAVANNGMHAALLMGGPVPISEFEAPLEQFAHFTLDLHCDGRRIDSGHGGNVLGSPLRALAPLAHVLAAQQQQPSLRAGEIVTTGTVTGAFPIAPGQRWESHLHGIALRGLSVNFTS